MREKHTARAVVPGTQQADAIHYGARKWGAFYLLMDWNVRNRELP
jgi:hypothetical protein